MNAPRRFPPPWSIEDGGGQKLAYLREAGGQPPSCSSRPLDPMVGSVNLDFMGPLHRAINMIVALTLVAIGGGGFVYFDFIDTTWSRWITIVAQKPRKRPKKPNRQERTPELRDSHRYRLRVSSQIRKGLE